jgi:hypothetical protein
MRASAPEVPVEGHSCPPGTDGVDKEKWGGQPIARRRKKGQAKGSRQPTANTNPCLPAKRGRPFHAGPSLFEVARYYRSRNGMTVQNCSLLSVAFNFDVDLALEFELRGSENKMKGILQRLVRKGLIELVPGTTRYSAAYRLRRQAGAGWPSSRILREKWARAPRLTPPAPLS